MPLATKNPSYFYTPTFPTHSRLKPHSRRSSDTSSSDTSSSSSDDTPRSPTTPADIHERHTSILRPHHLFLGSRSHKPNLRTEHLNVLTTILHRCLLAHEWDRAARAFGMLIRGKDVDLRRTWALGLDILLNQAIALQEREKEAGGDPITAAEANRKAIGYLQRLVVFFPFRPIWHGRHPVILAAHNEVDEEGVREIIESGVGRGGKGGKQPKKKKRKVLSVREKEVEEQKQRQAKMPAASAVDMNPALLTLLIESSAAVDPSLVTREVMGEVSMGEETRPEKVKEKLEELMMSPPWDAVQGMMVLRGMVCLWMVDVEKRLMVEERRERRAGRLGEDDGEEEKGRMGRIEELKKEAREFFEKAKSKGAKLSEGVEWWLQGGADVEYSEEEEEEEHEDERMLDVEQEGEGEEPEKVDPEVWDWGDDDEGDNETNDEEELVEKAGLETTEPEVWDWGDDDNEEEEGEGEEEDMSGTEKGDEIHRQDQRADANDEAELDEEPTGWQDYDYKDHRMRDVDDDSP